MASLAPSTWQVENTTKLPEILGVKFITRVHTLNVQDPGFTLPPAQEGKKNTSFKTPTESKADRS